MDDEASEELRQALAHISDRWSFSVLNQVARRSMRFGELLRAIEGISSRMLTETVRKLERDGIVVRHVGPECPPTVHYTLTATGHSLRHQLIGLEQWISQHRAVIQEHRKRYDADHKRRTASRTR